MPVICRLVMAMHSLRNSIVMSSWLKRNFLSSTRSVVIYLFMFAWIPSIINYITTQHLHLFVLVVLLAEICVVWYWMTWQSWEAVFAQWRRNGATSVRLSLHSGEEMGLPQFDCLCAVEKKCGYLSLIVLAQWRRNGATSVRFLLRIISSFVLFPSVCCYCDIICWHANLLTWGQHQYGVGRWAVPTQGRVKIENGWLF